MREEIGAKWLWKCRPYKGASRELICRMQYRKKQAQNGWRTEIELEREVWSWQLNTWCRVKMRMRSFWVCPRSSNSSAGRKKKTYTVEAVAFSLMGLMGLKWEQFYVLGSRKVRVHREKLFRGQNIEGKIVSGQYRKQKTDGTDISWGSISLPLLFYPCFCSSCAFMCFYLQDHM